MNYRTVFSLRRWIAIGLGLTALTLPLFAQDPATTSGLGPDFDAIKQALPKSQAETDQLSWDDYWKLFKGVFRDTGWGQSTVIPKKYAKFLSYGWTMDEKGVSFTLFDGIAVANKAGVAPGDRTQSGDDRFTKYLWDHKEVKLDPKTVTSIKLVYHGKSTEDASTAPHSQAYDSIILTGKFSVEDQLVEFDNEKGTDATYAWKEGTDTHTTNDEKTLTISFMGLDQNSLKAVGYMMIRVLTSHGATGIKLEEGKQ